MPPGDPADLVDLGVDGTSFVVDPAAGGGVLVHWGAALGADVALDATAAALTMTSTAGALDVVAPVAFVPEHGSGFSGTTRAQRAPRRRPGVGAPFRCRLDVA